MHAVSLSVALKRMKSHCISRCSYLENACHIIMIPHDQLDKVTQPVTFVSLLHVLFALKPRPKLT